MTVVFDGPERFFPRQSGLLIVRYAAEEPSGAASDSRSHATPGKTADTMIERLAYEIPDRSHITVVTQDRALGDFILGLGGQVWKPQRLLEEMNQ